MSIPEAEKLVREYIGQLERENIDLKIRMRNAAIVMDFLNRFKSRLYEDDIK